MNRVMPTCWRPAACAGGTSPGSRTCRAGQEIPYEESRHEPVGDFPNDGEPVTVIRPGYLWHAPGEAVLISKALVTRAKGASGR